MCDLEVRIHILALNLSMNAMDGTFLFTHYAFRKYLTASVYWKQIVEFCCFLILPCYQIWEKTSDNLDLSVLDYLAETLKSTR